MQRWLGIAHGIDSATTAVGRWFSWLAVAMVLVGAYNAVVRYLGRYLGTHLSSNAYIELQWYMFSLLFLMGAAYTLRRDGHVRVDVIYGRLGAKARAWIDLGGTLLFLIPFSVAAAFLTWPAVRNSWSVLEVSPDPGGLARYPIKTMILVAFLMLALQAVSETIRSVAVLKGHAVSSRKREGASGGTV